MDGSELRSILRAKGNSDLLFEWERHLVNNLMDKPIDSYQLSEGQAQTLEQINHRIDLVRGLEKKDE